MECDTQLQLWPIINCSPQIPNCRSRSESDSDRMARGRKRFSRYLWYCGGGATNERRVGRYTYDVRIWWGGGGSPKTDVEFVLRNCSIFRELFLPCMWFLSFQAGFCLHFHSAGRWKLAWKWKEPHTGKKEWSEYATIAEQKFYVCSKLSSLLTFNMPARQICK